jgi:hypothetical protein
MAVAIRYEPNHKSFRALMVSGQTQELADEAATAGVVVARAYAAGSRLPAEYIASIRRTSGPLVTFDGNPRRTARVHAAYPFIEFGSGIKSGGDSRGKPRPQGGYSEPYRILGRTAARIGSPPLGGVG